MRYRFTKEDCRRGGRAAASLSYPDVCSHCGAVGFASRMAYVGHLGLHGLANSLEDKIGMRFDLSGAANCLSSMGNAATDAFPANGAFATGADLLALYGWRRDSDGDGVLVRS